MWQVARTDQKLCNLRDTNWVIAQQTNLVLKHMVDWLKQHKDDRRITPLIRNGAITPIAKRTSSSGTTYFT